MESRQLALRGEGAQQRGRGRRERNDEATAAEVEGEEAENSATFAAIAAGVAVLATWHVLPRCRWASPWPYATWALHIGPALIGPALT